MVKLSTLYKYTVIVCCLLSLGLLLLTPREYIGTYIQRMMIFVLAMLLSARLLMIKDYSLYKSTKFANNYSICFFLGLTIVAKHSIDLYGYSNLFIFKMLLPYFFVLLAYPLIYIFLRDKEVFNFLNIVLMVVIFMMIIRFVSWFLYNYSGKIVFPRLLFQYDVWIRDGFQRMDTGGLFGIALVLSSVQALTRRNKWLYYSVVAFCIFFVSFVTRVRFQFMLSIFVFMVVYLSNQIFFKKSPLKKLLIYLGVFFVLLFLGQWIISFLEYALFSNKYVASTSVRLEGINHYWKLMLNKHSILGLGFMYPSYPNVEILMMRNPWSIYYLDDLGLLGTFFQMGIFILVTHGYLFYKTINVTLRSFKYADKQDFLFLLGLTIYIIVSNILLNTFDIQRLFDLPFYLAIISYYDGRLASNKFKNSVMSGL